MKIPARIGLPIGFAVLCSIGVLFVLWWQLKNATSVLPQRTGTGSVLGNYAPVAPSASAIDPRDRALLHLRQGDLLALRGEWTAAQLEYEQSVKDGGGLPALRKLAQAQLQRRDVEGVRASIRALRAAGARPEDLLLLESIVALRTGELVRARELLTNADDSPQKHYGQALLAIIEGNHDQAQVELQAVLGGWEPVLRSYARSLQAAYEEYALFPESSDLHRTALLGRALAQAQECELALPLLSGVTQMQPDYRDAWVVQGYCELITERTEAALVSLERAYSLDPSKPETQYFLARAYGGLGQHDNAITFLEYALQNGFSPASEVHRTLAKEAVVAGKLDLALEQFEVLLPFPESTVSDYAGFVTAAVALGKNEEAHVKAVEATQKFPQEGEAYELLGAALIALDRKDEARIALQTALEFDPFLESAKEKLETMDRN